MILRFHTEHAKGKVSLSTLRWFSVLVGRDRGLCALDQPESKTKTTRPLVCSLKRTAEWPLVRAPVFWAHGKGATGALRNGNRVWGGRPFWVVKLLKASLYAHLGKSGWKSAPGKYVHGATERTNCKHF